MSNREQLLTLLMAMIEVLMLMTWLMQGSEERLCMHMGMILCCHGHF